MIKFKDNTGCCGCMLLLMSAAVTITVIVACYVAVRYLLNLA